MGCSNTVLEGTAVWRYEWTLLQGSTATLPSYNPDMTLEAEMEDLTAGRICKRLIQNCITQCTALVLIQVVLGRNHDTYVLSDAEFTSRDSSVTTVTLLQPGQIRDHGSTPSTEKRFFCFLNHPEWLQNTPSLPFIEYWWSFPRCTEAKKWKWPFTSTYNGVELDIYSYYELMEWTGTTLYLFYEAFWTIWTD